MTIPTVTEIEEFKEDIDASEEFVNSSSLTFATRLGGTKDTISGILGKAAQGTLTTYSAATTYSNLTDWVEESGVVYRPLPSALPIGPEAFDSSNWLVAQDLTDSMFASVAAMVAYSGPRSAPGKLLYTTDYQTSSRGGGATYLVKTTSQASTDGDTIDEQVNHTLDNGYVAILQSAGTIDSQQAGILNDAEINDSIDALVDSEEEIFIPAGSFSFDASLDVARRTTIKGAGPGSGGTILTGDDSLIDFASTRYDELYLEGFSLVGPGEADISGAIGFNKTGNSNSNRETLRRLHITDWPVGINNSAGWGQDYNQLYVVDCDVGFQCSLAPIEANWSTSGYVVTNSYFATCGTGVNDAYAWNATYINPVIENCVETYVQNGSGTTTVIINPWFEDNTNPPQWRRGSIVMGGRGVEFTDVSLPAGRPQDAIVRLDRTGVGVFRSDIDNPEFWADGEGVRGFITNFDELGWEFVDNDDDTAKLLRTDNGGGIIARSSSSDTTEVTMSRVVGKRHRFGSQLDNTPELGLELKGSSSNAGSGRGSTRIVFSSGTYETGGGGATDYGDRWAIQATGNLEPLTDDSFDIGSGSLQVQDIYLANAATVSSDKRVKRDIKSIPQELLDFALTVELKQYKIANKPNGRNHFGIIIDSDFLKSLDKIYGINECAAFCHSVFMDSEGKKFTSDIRGVKLGDIWTVRYDEWQNILLEAMRRKILAL